MNTNDYSKIAIQIINLSKEDFALRKFLIKNKQLNDGYHEDMKKLHLKNAQILNEIIDNIGYPSVKKVGIKANEASWLVVQHSIGNPIFMKKYANLMEVAIQKKDEKFVNFAYLSDRIAVLEGKLQLFGTQFDWDENGVLSPNRYDNLKKVNERRESIGLNTLEVQTILMRNRAEKENQKPPIDYNLRKIEFENWKKLVGWIN